jgi:hypothetical protein
MILNIKEHDVHTLCGNGIVEMNYEFPFSFYIEWVNGLVVRTEYTPLYYPKGLSEMLKEIDVELPYSYEIENHEDYITMTTYFASIRRKSLELVFNRLRGKGRGLKMSSKRRLFNLVYSYNEFSSKKDIFSFAKTDYRLTEKHKLITLITLRAKRKIFYFCKKHGLSLSIVLKYE